jgi:hypothetical protein
MLPTVWDTQPLELVVPDERVVPDPVQLELLVVDDLVQLVVDDHVGHGSTPDFDLEYLLMVADSLEQQDEIKYVRQN